MFLNQSQRFLPLLVVFVHNQSPHALPNDGLDGRILRREIQQYSGPCYVPNEDQQLSADKLQNKKREIKFIQENSKPILSAALRKFNNKINDAHREARTQQRTQTRTVSCRFMSTSKNIQTHNKLFYSGAAKVSRSFPRTNSGYLSESLRNGWKDGGKFATHRSGKMVGKRWGSEDGGRRGDLPSAPPPRLHHSRVGPEFFFCE